MEELKKRVITLILCFNTLMANSPIDKRAKRLAKYIVKQNIMPWAFDCEYFTYYNGMNYNLSYVYMVPKVLLEKLCLFKVKCRVSSIICHYEGFLRFYKYPGEQIMAYATNKKDAFPHHKFGPRCQIAYII